jgi:hypothetical protein
MGRSYRALHGCSSSAALSTGGALPTTAQVSRPRGALPCDMAVCPGRGRPGPLPSRSGSAFRILY